MGSGPNGYRQPRQASRQAVGDIPIRKLAKKTLP